MSPGEISKFTILTNLADGTHRIKITSSLATAIGSVVIESPEPGQIPTCVTPQNSQITIINSNTDLCTGSYTNVTLMMQANNIILDCKASILDGSVNSNSMAVVNTTGFSSVLIRNCNVRNSFRGIYFKSSSGSSAIANNLNSVFIGIIAENSPRTIIDSNSIFNAGNIGSGDSVGIYIPAGSLLTIVKDNLIRNFRYGMSVFSGINITNNTILTSDFGVAVWTPSSGTTINSNMFRAIRFRAILISSSNNNRILNNDINDLQTPQGIFVVGLGNIINSNVVCGPAGGGIDILCSASQIGSGNIAREVNCPVIQWTNNC